MSKWPLMVIKKTENERLSCNREDCSVGEVEGAVLDSVSSPITKRVYNMALNEFMAWFQQAPRPGFTKATVSAWRASLEERRLGSSFIIIRMAHRIEKAHSYVSKITKIRMFTQRISGRAAPSTSPIGQSFSIAIGSFILSPDVGYLTAK
jgi:hypothetical protein